MRQDEAPAERTIDGADGAMLTSIIANGAKQTCRRGYNEVDFSSGAAYK